MVKKWLSSIAVDLARMTDVTDDRIREMSNGEVTWDYGGDYEYKLDDKNRGDSKGTLYDAEIFGSCDDSDLNRMGHIELPVSVVNVQYTRGRVPELASVLGMTLKDLESVIYFARFILKDDDWNQDIPLYTEKEKVDQRSNGTFVTGAEAVKLLLEYKGIDYSKYILNTIPVMPLCMRYSKQVERDSDGNNITFYVQMSINTNYARVIRRANRIKHFNNIAGVEMPEIIMRNEHRMLQEYVDSLINNGTRGIPAMNVYGEPYDSLHELYEVITNGKRKKAIDLQSFIAQTKFDADQLKSKLSDHRIACAGDDDDDTDDGEYRVLTDEEEERIQKATDEIVETTRPLVKKVLSDQFSRYSAKYEDIEWLTRRVVMAALSDWDANDETAVELLYPLLYRHLHLYFLKQYMIDQVSEEE